MSIVTKRVIENFSFLSSDMIGQGYSSKVYKGKNDISNLPVALKLIDLSKINNEVQTFLLKNEISVL